MGNRITGTTREGTRLIALKTDGVRTSVWGLELGWLGRKRERAVEAQREWAETGASAGKHARRDLYCLWGLSFSLGLGMLGWWRNFDSSAETRPAYHLNVRTVPARRDKGSLAQKLDEMGKDCM